MTEQQKALTEAQETLTLRLSRALADYLQSTAGIEWAELPEDWHPHKHRLMSGGRRRYEARPDSGASTPGHRAGLVGRPGVVARQTTRGGHMIAWALPCYLALWAHLESDLRGCVVAYCLRLPVGEA